MLFLSPKVSGWLWDGKRLSRGHPVVQWPSGNLWDSTGWPRDSTGWPRDGKFAVLKPSGWLWAVPTPSGWLRAVPRPSGWLWAVPKPSGCPWDDEFLSQGHPEGLRLANLLSQSHPDGLGTEFSHPKAIRMPLGQNLPSHGHPDGLGTEFCHPKAIRMVFGRPRAIWMTLGQ